MSNKKRPHSRYDKQQLIRAVRAVVDNEMTSMESSIHFHIPESTIRSHVRNPSLHVGAGRKFYLTSKQEHYLVDLIKTLEKTGVRLTKMVLKKVIGEFINYTSTDNRFNGKYTLLFHFNICSLGKEPSLHWLSNFLNRNKKEIKMVKEKKLDKKRRNGFTEEVRLGWLEKVKKTLTNNSLIHTPMNIFNVDESGFADDTQSK
ncbi:unnamed protein product [Rotaria sp. Silwood1]|nr:unnamed protein product [Rotaria sp. Silwood1]